MKISLLKTLLIKHDYELVWYVILYTSERHCKHFAILNFWMKEVHNLQP